jgi:hypothetical protein
MADAASFPLFNFFTLWEMAADAAMPTLQRHWDVPAAPRTVALADLQGSGTAEDPYLLHDASEMRAMRLALNAHYRLAQDIDATETALWFSGLGWEPVQPTGYDVFEGKLNGDGYAIRGLTVNRDEYRFSSLLGHTADCVVENLDLLGVYVFGRGSAGALVGEVDNGRFRNINATVLVGSIYWNTGGLVGKAASDTEFDHVTVQGSVISPDFSPIGGLVGDLRSSQVSRVFVDVTVSGNDRVGGLIGREENCQIQDCGAVGQVEGRENQIGGLIGYNYRGEVADCYSLASVSGTSEVGGLIGAKVGYRLDAVLYRSYAAGVVNATTQDYVGGLVGKLAAGTVTDAFWDMEASGLDSSAGGTGKTTAEMNQSTPFTHAGWDFEGTWFRHLTANDGYPFLRHFAHLENFTQAGIPYAWLELHGLPTDGSVDHAVPVGKSQSILDHYIFGTDPADLQSRFAATPSATGGSGFEIHFHPSLPERHYTLFRSTDLTSEWLPVPDMQNLPGGNGPLVDTEPPEGSAFYRVKVTMP